MDDESTSWDYATALRAIWARSGYDRGYVSNPFAGDEAARLGLRRTAALLGRLGRPQERYGIVHVAGSKGKGSTCAFVDSILRVAGWRVGLYTSPHLHSFRERIAVDGAPIDEATFARQAQRAVAAAEALERDQPCFGEVTAFELTTAMALEAFAAAGCDLAVVEVGLGGLYDATNVVDPLVTAITTMDLEHTAILGRTLPEIAVQKAGIVKPGRPVAVSPQAPEALRVIEQVAAERVSQVLVGGRDWTWSGSWRHFQANGPWGELTDLRSGLPGDHQIDNACTALAAIWLLGRAGFAAPEAAVRAGLLETRWPGRFERLTTLEGVDVVLDGAHSPASAAALAAAVAGEEPDRQAVLVLGTMEDKDQGAIVAALAPIARRVVATAAKTPRAAPPESILDAARSAGVPADDLPTVAEAMARAIELAGTDGLVVVTGSLAVVAEARAALGLGVPDPPVPAP
jgi:dihydrofolate synthase / folylpolyglutamate synthase